jgi:trypsin
MMRAVIAAALVSFTVGFRQARKVNASASCGAKGGRSTPDEVGIQIVNGQPAEECEWKWQVGLRQGPGSMPFCGGMLIAADWVLSAAHCMGLRSFQVVAGDHKPLATSGNEQVRNMAQKYSHPRYSSRTMNFDLALVKLDRPMDLNGCVGTVCLPQRGSDVAPGSSCWITGWGTLRAGGSQPSTLQEGKVEVLSNAACKQTSYSSSSILDSMVCAQGKTSTGAIVDACQGDSGGPLVCESGGAWTVYGATSWGIGCAGRTYPGIWARVHEGLDWIDSTMR